MGPLLSGALAGLASWVLLGAQGFPDALRLPERIALLPDARWLPPAVLAMTTLAWAVRRRVPATWGWAIGLALLPWLPVALPAALLFTPRVLLLVAAMALAVAAGPRLLQGLAAAPASRAYHRHLPFAALLLVGALYGCGAWLLQPRLPGGDEPHYLVIAQSLLKDGDLRIENNHRAADYAAYHQGELRPHFLRRGQDGEIYSVHAPGLPAVVAPAFALGGYPGVVAFLVLVALAGIAAVWRAGEIVSASREAAWVGAAAVALSVPYACLAFSVYPEMVAAAIVAAAALALVSGTATTGRRVLTGAGLALLPWLHTRYAVLAAGFGVLLVLREWGAPGRWRRIGELLCVPAPSALAWLAFFTVVYGAPDPSAPYGGFAHADTSLAHAWRGVPGLLLDQQFGLLAVAPVFTAAAIGLVALARRRGAPAAPPRATWRLALELTIVVVPYLLVTGSYAMWWGGSSVPARFLVPVLPVLGLLVAVAWATARAQATRLFVLAGLGITACATGTFLLVGHGELAYNARDGRALWLEWLNPLVDLTAIVPSVHGRGPADALVTALVWVACGALAWGALRALERRGVAALAPAATALAACAAMAAATVGWARSGQETYRATASQAWLLSGYDAGRRPLALRLPSRPERFLPERLAAGEALRAVQIRGDVLPGVRGGPAPVLVARDLPPGRYRLHVTRPAGLATSLVATSGRQVPPLLTVAMPAEVVAVDADVVLPVPLPSLTVSVPGTAAGHRATLTPIEIGPAAGVPPNRPATRAVRYGDTTVFFLNSNVFPERTGFWTVPGVPTPVVLQPVRSGAPMRLYLRNGPELNTVSLTVRGWGDRLSLSPGEERVLDLPGGRDGRPVLLELQAAHGFVPREVDPHSHDARRLAVWIEPR